MFAVLVGPKKLAVLIAAAALTILANGALAQVRESDCSDDRGVDRCSAAQQAKVRSLFGLERIETLAARDAAVRRAVYVDGYGNDVVAVSFLRLPGSGPVVEVRAPRSASAAPVEPLRALVPLELWSELLDRSRYFDRALAKGQEPINLCLHSWVFTVEAADPPSPSQGQDRKIRSAVEDACEDGLAEPYAMYLATAAVKLLPACAALDPARHRNDPERLRACTRLRGDRLAAAAVMNLGPEQLNARLEDRSRPQPSFGHLTNFDWNGERSRLGWEAATKYWRDKLAAEDASFMAEVAYGERFDRVRLQGKLWRSSQLEGKARHEVADATLTLTFEPSQTFNITAVKVGPFRPAPSP